METRTRRQILVLGSSSLVLACGGNHAKPTRSDAERDDLAVLEWSIGGRLGVFALDTGSGKTLTRRADERFAMCSTFKWLLGAAIFSRVDRGELALEEKIPFGEGDLIEHAQVTRERVSEGAMSIFDLVEATIRTSDNAAANLLLRRIGGPASVTDFARSLGDEVTRLDRDEPSLNENAAGDPRDTTSPRAMAGLLRRSLWDEAVLSKASRTKLTDILRSTETGKKRLRGGFPSSWDSGDKTGTGDKGAVSDIAFTIPPGRAPIVVAVYTSHSEFAREKIEKVHVEVAKLVARNFG